MSKYIPKLKKILVLTPDSIGSTFFQRSLTVFLNLHDIPTKNYHDLANHLANSSLNSLIYTLTTEQHSVVARLSPYRSNEIKKHRDKFFKFCNLYFKDIFIVERCSFESILSYCHTTYRGTTLNVYNKERFKDIQTEPYEIPENVFIEGIKYFEDFYMWVDQYFPIYKKISYGDLVINTNQTYYKTFNIPVKKSPSLEKYNKFNFKRLRDLDLSEYTKDDLLEFIEMNDYIQYLSQKQFLIPERPFPFKKITLQEKFNSIKNLTYLHDIYCKYPSNHLEQVSFEELQTRALKEDLFWTT